MHRSALLLPATLLLLSACSDDGGSDPPPPDPVTFRLASFNVKNFFDAEDDPFTLDDLPTASEMNAKIGHLGTAFRLIDADILALQEVENLDLLKRLNDLEQLGYTELHLVRGNDPRGIDVALLSRIPVKGVNTHKDDKFPGVDDPGRSFSFSRDCLAVALEPYPGRTLTLLVNHLKATNLSNPGDSTERREAQAKRLQGIVEELATGKQDPLIAVLGDLNDSPTSRTLNLIRGASTPLSDLHDALAAADRITTSWNKTVDYLLASPALEATLVAGSPKVDQRDAFGKTSDHYPVSASFTFK